MDKVMFYDCYSYDDEWYLVEMLLDVPSSEIDWGDIVVPEDGTDESDWQCAYMEQYLNEDGTEKICETYDIPSDDVQPVRVAFFIYKDSADILSTPYGSFKLDDTKKMPARLKNIIEFEED